MKKHLGWMVFFETILVLLPLTSEAVGFVRSRYYTGARCMAVGDACLSWISDESAAFYNPAGLVRTKLISMELFNAQVTSNKDTYDFIRKNLSRDRIRKAGKNYEVITGNQDKELLANLTMFPYIQLPNILIGAVGSIGTDINIGEGDLPSDPIPLIFTQTSDAGLIGGVGMRFFGGIVKLGYSAYWLDRAEIDKTVDYNENVDIGLNKRAGQAVAHTGGLIITAPIKYLPTVAFVARDIGDTNFKKHKGIWAKDPAEAPSQRRASYDAEFSWSPRVGRLATLAFAAGYRDIQNRYREAAGAHWHGGAELEIGKLVFLRGGYYNGYGTGGLGLDLKFFSVEATTFSQEVGTKFQGRESRLYMLQLKAGL